MRDQSSIKQVKKKAIIKKMINVLGRTFIILGLFLCINTILSIHALADDPNNTGIVDPETITDPYPYDVIGDVTIDVSHLHGDKTINGFFLGRQSTLTITGNSEYRLILSGGISSDPYGFGNVVINGGNIEINSSISNVSSFTMNGGSLTLRSSLEAEDVNINGGQLVTVGDSSGISAQNITVSGGSITMVDGHSGLEAENNLVISGGTIDLRLHAVECIYGNNVTISGGDINVSTSVGDNHVCLAIFGHNITIQTDRVDVISPDGWSIGTIPFSSAYNGILKSDGTVATNVIIRQKRKTNNNRVQNIAGGGVEGAPFVPLPPHEHSYRWETVTKPTAESDGLEVYKCIICDDVKESNVLSALSVFDAELIEKIEKCPLNGTVFIETTHWNSFGRGVRDAMIERPDVTIKASFLSKGHTGIPLKVTIPCGRSDLFDSNGYLGLCRAGTELGYDN